MEAEEQALLTKIGEARFACVELGLYLDTHPEDLTAQNDYNCYSEKLRALLSSYSASYGPLMNFGQCPHDTGSWVYAPWPWENL